MTYTASVVVAKSQRGEGSPRNARRLRIVAGGRPRVGLGSVQSN